MSKEYKVLCCRSFAWTIEDMINKMAKRGWQFETISPCPVDHRTSVLGVYIVVSKDADQNGDKA